MHNNIKPVSSCARVDLHIHSTASDGTLTPSAVAAACKELSLSYAALSDHDTLAGVSEFLQAARTLSLRAVSALEFNVTYDGEMHILGYGVDIENKALLGALHTLEAQREKRAYDMVAKLNRNGVSLSMERVEQIGAGGVLGRPHIARALVEAGYAPDVESAFPMYLNQGCIGYCLRKKIDSDLAINLIREAGGVAVLAHPKLTCYPDFDELLTRLTGEGLEGIEAYYPAHSDEEVAYFLSLADRYGLLVTQGSDYHGQTRKSSALYGERRGGARLTESVEEIFSRAACRSIP